MPSHAITPASTSSAAPLIWAETISARPKPNVKRPPGGRAASRAAASASAIAPASVSMCAASESSASESAIRPAAISTTKKPRISPSATPSQRRSASGDGAWLWAWPPWPWSCARHRQRSRYCSRSVRSQSLIRLAASAALSCTLSTPNSLKIALKRVT